MSCSEAIQFPKVVRMLFKVSFFIAISLLSHSSFATSSNGEGETRPHSITFESNPVGSNQEQMQLEFVGGSDEQLAAVVSDVAQEAKALRVPIEGVVISSEDAPVSKTQLMIESAGRLEQIPMTRIKLKKSFGDRIADARYRFLDWLAPHSRGTIALTRMMVNGVITAYGFVHAPGSSLESSLLIGAVVGAMSGGVSYYMEHFRSYVGKKNGQLLAQAPLARKVIDHQFTKWKWPNKILNFIDPQMKLQKQFPRYGEVEDIPNSSDVMEKSKWGFTEMIFIAAIKSSMALTTWLGWSHLQLEPLWFSTDLAEFRNTIIGDTFVNAGATLGSQGTWDLYYIAKTSDRVKVLKELLRSRVITQSEYDTLKTRAEMANAGRSLGISAVWAAVTVTGQGAGHALQQYGVTIDPKNLALAGHAAMGLVGFAKLYRYKKNREKEVAELRVSLIREIELMRANPDTKTPPTSNDPQSGHTNSGAICGVALGA